VINRPVIAWNLAGQLRVPFRLSDFCSRQYLIALRVFRI
jgi:hypothetical protein